jgi:hypothetical protein
VVIGYGNWADIVIFDGRVGPRNAFYEERAQDGGLQSLPFVRVVLDDGYPALCQVPLPRDEDWNAQTPPWARGRREEIISRMNDCLAARRVLRALSISIEPNSLLPARRGILMH